MTKAQFAALLAATTPETTKNAALFALYLRFLALTGPREKEALCVRWADVDFTLETVTIGSGGASKNHRARDVDFSPELKALLVEMFAARPPAGAGRWGGGGHRVRVSAHPPEQWRAVAFYPRVHVPARRCWERRRNCWGFERMLKSGIPRPGGHHTGAGAVSGKSPSPFRESCGSSGSFPRP